MIHFLSLFTCSFPKNSLVSWAAWIFFNHSFDSVAIGNNNNHRRMHKDFFNKVFLDCHLKGMWNANHQSKKTHKKRSILHFGQFQASINTLYRWAYYLSTFIFAWSKKVHKVREGSLNFFMPPFKIASGQDNKWFTPNKTKYIFLLFLLLRLSKYILCPQHLKHKCISSILQIYIFFSFKSADRHLVFHSYNGNPSKSHIRLAKKKIQLTLMALLL